MVKKILLFCFLISITSCQKDNPVSPNEGGSTQTTGNTWTAKTGMPTARGYFCCAEVNGKIYLIGGLIDLTPEISDDVEMYDPETDKWTIKNHMPEKILGMAAAAVDGKIYTFGGRTGALYDGTTLDYTYLYDPATDTWTRKTNIPEPRAFLTASVIDGKIYTIGGAYSRYEGAAEVQVYDPATDTWTPKASLPKGSALSSAAVFNGKIYVVGGGTSNDAGAGTPFADFEVYDPSNNFWESKEDITISRVGHGSGVINNKLYICGGFSYSTELSDLMEYDFSKDSWTTRAAMPSTRRCFATCVHNNKMYIFGGVIGIGGTGHTISSVIEYTPLGNL